eukprot:scaffold3619_cov742-Pavlova_lutheri.AAC.1
MDPARESSPGTPPTVVHGMVSGADVARGPLPALGWIHTECARGKRGGRTRPGSPRRGVEAAAVPSRWTGPGRSPTGGAPRRFPGWIPPKRYAPDAKGSSHGSPRDRRPPPARLGRMPMPRASDPWRGRVLGWPAGKAPGPRPPETKALSG